MSHFSKKCPIIFTIIFAFFSILSVYCSLDYSSSSLGNLAIKQLFWYMLGFLLIFFIIRKKSKFFFDNAWLLYIIGIFLLIYLILFGEPINNSKCWIIIPGIGSFQPSEFMKLFLIFVLVRLVNDFKEINSNPTLYQEFILILKSFIIFIVPTILTFLQPDTGAVIIYFKIYIFIMFFSGIRLRWFLFALLFICFIISFCGCLYYFNEDLFVKIFGYSMYYRLDRLFLWTSGDGLQLENAIAAIGSGYFFGHGFANTPIYFPEAATDFIFAVYASNFGFLGVTILLITLFSFDFYILFLIKNCSLYSYKLFLGGVLGMILFQQIQNIGMTIGLFPIMGITLPFISYGGSSLLSYLILIGIIKNIASTKTKKYN